MRVRLKHRALAELLARSRRTQNGWAHRLGLAPGHLSRLVNGRRPYPGVGTREKLMRGLGVEFDDLFEVETRRPQPRSPAASRPVRSTRMPRRRPKGDSRMLQLGSMIRIAARGLYRNPTFTAVALGTLAIGVGLTTAMFSVIDQVLVQPLPFPEPERLVRIYHQHPPDGALTAVSPLGLRDYQGSGTAEMMAAFQAQDVNLSGSGEPARIRAAMASPELFELLGGSAAVGRLFTADDSVEGGDSIVVLSDRLWRTRFGSDVGMIGRTIRLDAVAHVVVGVASPGFGFPSDVELWKPLTIPDIMYTEDRRGWEYLGVLARLRHGLGAHQASEAMIGALREAAPRRYDRGQRVAAVPLREDLVGDTRRGLLALFGAASLLLLLACVNVANLFLVRAEQREAEFSLRIMLGSGRQKLLSQLLVESSLIAISGGLAGWAATVVAIRLLNALSLAPLAAFGPLALDWRALGFTFAVTAAASLAFASLPALHALRSDLATAVKGAGRMLGARRQWLRRGLVGAEVAAALVLLMGTLVFLRSFDRLQAVDPGFDPEARLSFRIELPRSQYPPRQRLAFYRDLQQRVGAIAGIENAAFVSTLPLEGRRWTATFDIVGRQRDPDQPQAGANMRVASPGYFETMGIPLREGRLPAVADIGGPPVAVVDETVARRLWPDDSAVGQQLTDSVMGEEAITIVGVVGTVKDDGLHIPSNGHVYFLLGQLAERGMTLVARSALADPMGLASQLREALHSVDPALPFADVKTLERHVADSLTTPRLSTLLLSLFGTVALLLAAGGIYGLTAVSVSRRRSEIGVRMALGARRSSVLGLVLREALGLWLGGAVVGAALASGFGHVVSSLLYEVSPSEPLTLIAAALGMGLITAAAALAPARRAMSLDCVEALRAE